MKNLKPTELQIPRLGIGGVKTSLLDHGLGGMELFVEAFDEVTLEWFTVEVPPLEDEPILISTKISRRFFTVIVTYGAL